MYLWEGAGWRIGDSGWRNGPRSGQEIGEERGKRKAGMQRDIFKALIEDLLLKKGCDYPETLLGVGGLDQPMFTREICPLQIAFG
jgi:hypothetical protein